MGRAGGAGFSWWHWRRGLVIGVRIAESRIFASGCSDEHREFSGVVEVVPVASGELACAMSRSPLVPGPFRSLTEYQVPVVRTPLPAQRRHQASVPDLRRRRVLPDDPRRRLHHPPVAYGLRKLRGKDLLIKPGRSRRYRVPGAAAEGGLAAADGQTGSSCQAESRPPTGDSLELLSRRTPGDPQALC